MKTRFLIIIILAFSTSIFAQLDRSKMPEPAEAPEIQLGNYESFTLDNGLKVFVVENNKLPRVTFQLKLDRDPIMEKEAVGYISAAGELLRTGTKSRSKDEIDEAVDFIGATLRTNSIGVFGASLKKHTDVLFELMADVILNAEFKQEELDKIKKQKISGLQAGKDDPSFIASNVRKVLMYGKDHPYGEIETEETVEAITLDKCIDYYKTYFRPNIAYLAIVGDITKDEAEELVTKYLSGWEKKEVPTFKYKKVKSPLVRKVAVVDRPVSVQSVINVTYPIKLEKFSDDALKASLLNHILGGTSTARFFMNLREDKGYTYGAYSSIASDELVGNFRASCEARNSVTDSAITEFLAEMKKIKNEPVSAEELQSAKNNITGSFARSLEYPETVANFAINIERYNLPSDYYKNYLKRLNAVTVEELTKTAKKYIKPDKAYILVVSNAEEVAGNLKKFSLSGKVKHLDIYGDPYDPSLKKVPSDLTAEMVMEKSIEASGGKEKLAGIKDKIMILKGSVQGMEITVEIHQKSPNKYYQKLDAGMMKMEVIFDGEKGTTIAQGNSNPMDESTAEKMKVDASMNFEINYPSLGIKLEVDGIEKIDGVETYRIKGILPSGAEIFRYYSIETGLLAQTISEAETPRGKFKQVLKLSDYREVSGVKLPHKITQSMGPMNIPMTVENYVVNGGIDDSRFSVK